MQRCCHGTKFGFVQHFTKTRNGIGCSALCYNVLSITKNAELIAGAEAAQQETLQQLGEYIQGESTAIAPLRGGALIASSYVEPSAENVRIGYNIIYANRQHEELNFFHPNGRQAQYLQKIMEDPNTQAHAEMLFGQNLMNRIGR